MEIQSKLNEQLLLMEEKLLQPEFRKSVKDLTILIADDFIELGSSGRTYNKQQVIAGSPTSPMVQMTLMDFQAKLLAPGVALTIYRVAKHSKQDELLEYSLRSSIWILQEGKWRIMFHQGTPSIDK
ncbi:MAG: DUF4440 domain-containing protein [Firmicutes bacterium HGW-Firmicutes-15]|nr:MAG: DUF4440 domain-containing protein [Firmicutes bacterium HGW-Firmicutes-15]